MLITASYRLRPLILFASCSFAIIVLALATCAGPLNTVHAQASPASRNSAPASAQAAPASPHDIADTWQGTLHTGRDLRIVVKVTKDDKVAYKGAFYSIDQGGQPSLWIPSRKRARISRCR